MDNTQFSELMMTPLSRKTSNAEEFLYYSPSPQRSVSLLSSPWASISQSPSDQIELLRMLRQNTMNPQDKDEKFLRNEQAEMLDFIQELDEMNLSSE